jgi:hypothetical protein
MLQVGFEPVIPVFEQSKTVHTIGTGTNNSIRLIIQIMKHIIMQFFCPSVTYYYLDPNTAIISLFQNIHSLLFEQVHTHKHLLQEDRFPN